MLARRKKRKKKKKLTWQDIVMIILVVVLALLLIFSRGFRAARRVNIDPQHDEQKLTAVTADNHPAAGFYHQDYVTAVNSTPDPQAASIAAEPGKNGVQAFNRQGSGSLPLNEDLDMEGNSMQPEDISKEMLLGRVNPASETEGFSLIESRYARRDGMYLRSEALDAFVKMYDAAEKDGIQLMVLSATRTFDHQRRIWENKWNGERMLHGNIRATDIRNPAERSREILRFSAMPGTSRHHWGTDVDLNSLQNSYFEQGQGKRVYQWLADNAAAYGFCQPYTAHGERRDGGYEEEKWHWSYKPIAVQFYHTFAEKISYEDIIGFDGAETARELQVIENYVLDVNRDCF